MTDPGSLIFVGRGEKIRTSDPLHPMQVRYQAALRPDEAQDSSRVAGSGGSPSTQYFEYCLDFLAHFF